MKKKKFRQYGAADKALLLTGYILLGLFVVAIVLPMLHLLRFVRLSVLVVLLQFLMSTMVFM